MTIVIVTPYFPPDKHIASNRWYRFVKYFVQANHKVTIITPSKDGFTRFIKCPNDGIIDPIIDKINIIRVPNALFTSIKLYLFRILEIITLSIPRYLAFKAGFKRDSKLFVFIENLLIDFKAILFFPDYSWEWAVNASKSKYLLNKLPDGIDVVVGSHPFAGSIKLAYEIAKLNSSQFVTDFRDPWHNDVQIKGFYYPKIQEKLERKYLKLSNAVVTINKYLAEMLHSDKKIDIIPNTYIPREKNLIDENRISTPLKITYIGNINIKSYWKIFFNSLTKIKKINSIIEIHYYGPTYSFIEKYEDLLYLRNIRLINHGYVSFNKSIEACEESDLLLVFGWHGDGHKCVMTGKVFDYLSVDKPIIAASMTETALSDLIIETRSGIVLSTEDDIKIFFEEILDNDIRRGQFFDDYYEKSDKSKYLNDNCSIEYLEILNRTINDNIKNFVDI